MQIDNTLIMYVANGAIALVIFFLGKALARWVTDFILKKLTQSGKMDDTLKSFFSSVLYSLLLIIVALTALAQAGIETTSFIAILGAVGLAVALSFKDTLSNISAGVMIIIFRPIEVGEYVEAGGTSGTIEEINIFNTIMKTPDNKTIIVANARVIANNIVNYSRKTTRRVDITFGVGYEDDLKLVKKTLQEIIQEDTRILSDPEPFVAVSALADSSVNFVTRSWVKSGDYWPVYFDTIEKVKLTFDEKGISIPFPQMDLHVNKDIQKS